MTSVLLLQEIVTPEPGIQYHVTKHWHIIYGRQANEWRGEGIAYQSDLGAHERSCCVPGGVATSLVLERGKVGLLSGHIPHHATVQQVDNMIHEWGETATFKHQRLILGMDANETLAMASGRLVAATGQGNTVLQWMVEENLYLPDQVLSSPSHFPYNTEHKPRRIDYILLRGAHAQPGKVLQARDMALSDHEPIAMSVYMPDKRHKQSDQAPTWGAKQLLHPEDVAKALDQDPKQGDPYHIRDKASGGPERRAAWKAVHKQRRTEKRDYESKLAAEASQLDWHAFKKLKQLHPATGWEEKLLDDPDWEQEKIRHVRGELTRHCKRRRWHPFTLDELTTTAERWKPRKSTGIDGVAYESFKAMLRAPSPKWAWYVLSLINDCFYKANIPEAVGRGATILLPKEHVPSTWAATRPITLSNTLLRWMAQLLLHRCQPYLDLHCYYQYCSTGRQAQELILALRRLMRMAKDWGVKLWLVKVDVRKAFDSIAQDALAVMVRDSVAKRGGLVWESRMWLEILEAKAIDIYIGKSLVSVTQTNGVRQGSPDSAVLYSASIGETLQDLHDNVPLGEAGRADLPQCPSQGAGYMDDTYLWSENAKAMQRAITYLEEKLGKKGNVVNVVKTQILCSEPDDTEFCIGGQKVKAGGATDIMNALGSPLTFEKSGVTALTADLQARGRRAFHAHRRLLCARTPLENRMKMLTTLVRNSATWGCATWPNNAALLRAANACQLGCVRAMIGTKRGATESWAEWQVRTMRMARVALFNSRQERWSTYALRQMWKLHGHAARHPGPTKDLLLWRNLKWWKEVAEPAGCKHGGRFNSSVDIERSISRIGGYDWVDLAQDRDQWQALQDSFVEEFDLPWASGRQPAIANLTQIRSFKPKSQPKPTAALTDSVASGRMTPGIPAGASASDSQSSSASAKS
ncbi:unnamed protein product [Symbiodinium sp. CCMP2592]|nr:unnamed protein product [Symbiodinium sp. CCMP2592]